MSRKNKLLLILGPSGVGKTTIIEQLKVIDNRFVYISPYTTRKLKEGEQDKNRVSLLQFHKMAVSGKFLSVNEIFGTFYGTPKKPIRDALKEGKFPVLDWPVNKLEVMRENFGNQLFCAYLKPPSLAVLQHRLDDGRDPEGSRYQEGARELRQVDSYTQKFSPIDLFITNHTGVEMPYVTALRIYKAYCDNL